MVGINNNSFHTSTFLFHSKPPSITPMVKLSTHINFTSILFELSIHSNLTIPSFTSTSLIHLLFAASLSSGTITTFHPSSLLLAFFSSIHLLISCTYLSPYIIKSPLYITTTAFIHHYNSFINTNKFLFPFQAKRADTVFGKTDHWW